MTTFTIKTVPPLATVSNVDQMDVEGYVVNVHQGLLASTIHTVNSSKILEMHVIQPRNVTLMSALLTRKVRRVIAPPAVNLITIVQLIMLVQAVVIVQANALVPRIAPCHLIVLWGTSVFQSISMATTRSIL